MEWEGTKEEKDGSPNSSTTVTPPVTEPVVSTPIDVKSHDENETIDHENDVKDETQAKDNDLSGVLSDSESVRGGGRGSRGRRGGRGGGQPRASKK